MRSPLVKHEEFLLSLPSVPDELSYHESIWPSGHFWPDSENPDWLILQKNIDEQAIALSSSGTPVPWRNRLTTSQIMYMHFLILQECLGDIKGFKVDHVPELQFIVNKKLLAPMHLGRDVWEEATFLPDVASLLSFMKGFLLDYCVGLRRQASEVLWMRDKAEYVFLPSALAFGYGGCVDSGTEFEQFCSDYELLELKFGLEWFKHVDLVYSALANWWQDVGQSIIAVVSKAAQLAGVPSDVIEIILDHLKERAAFLQHLLETQEHFLKVLARCREMATAREQEYVVGPTIHLALCNIFDTGDIQLVKMNNYPKFLLMASESYFDCVRFMAQWHTRGYYVAVGFLPISRAQLITDIEPTQKQKAVDALQVVHQPFHLGR